MAKYKAIGVMSGTSLDGIDIAYCEFSEENEKWNYKIVVAETIPYNSYWRNSLSDAENLTAFDFVRIDMEYGHFLGTEINQFISRHRVSPDFIACHGHTIFHQPGKKITCQIGDGAAIAALCQLPVVCDFRALDVALGGQGAPLVPFGDKYLFPVFDYCINLGGFANISFERNEKRVAFDICPVNIVLNRIAETMGKPFDRDGEFALMGMIQEALLKELNDLTFYQQPPPKSLGKEWLLSVFLPAVDKFNISSEDKLRTLCEHISMQVANIIHARVGGKMLVTGGGAHNAFLMSRLRQHCNVEIVLPDNNTIDYKEALIFAFLGVQRMTGRVNCLKSATGASRDNIDGAVYLG